jgi:TolB-like protein/DNA-binding winged helix-turn-helix (wHTH) protein
MDDTRRTAGVWRFGVFEADLEACELRKNGMKVRLQGQPFHVLAVLLGRSGELVRREELRNHIWSEDTFVEFDDALNTAVKKIRVALCDDAAAPRYVETIPRRGYRFIAAVCSPADAKSASVPGVRLEDGCEQNSSSRLRVTGKVLVILAVVLLIGLQVTHRLHAGQSSAERPIVLAVLPFEAWSDDSQLAYVCEGITQELIAEQGGTDPRQLAVVARSTAEPYRHTSKSVQQIGQELHADYVLEGNLRSDGDHLRVSAELIRVRDQARLWGQDFSGEYDNLLAVEREVARSVVAQVRAGGFPERTR